MEKLVINRGELLTGTALKINDSSYLYDKDCDLYCCLGLYARDVHGVSAARLEGKSFPSRVLPKVKWLRNKTDAGDSSYLDENAEQVIAAVNDAFEGHPKRREQKIAKLFKKYGNVDVTFTGSYREGTEKAKRAQR